MLEMHIPNLTLLYCTLDMKVLRVGSEANKHDLVTFILSKLFDSNEKCY